MRKNSFNSIVETFDRQEKSLYITGLIAIFDVFNSHVSTFCFGTNLNLVLQHYLFWYIFHEEAKG